MIQVFDDRIEFTQGGKAMVLRFVETRVAGVLVSEMSPAEKQAYIERSVAKIEKIADGAG